MKRPVISLFFVTALLAAPGPAAKPELFRAEGSVDAMGSTYSIVIYGEDRERLQAIVAQGLEEARRLDHLLSNYIPGSEWSQVNRLAAVTGRSGFSGVVPITVGVRGIQQGK